jgi:Protein of unknown function (DUF2911)
MKKIIFPFLFLIIASGIRAQVTMPAPSPTQTIRQEFALGSIEVTYSRPASKGRKVFGDLVPFNKLWRTGANAATIVKFSDEVEIKGKKIDSGTYALYTIPGPETWEIILNKGITNWGIDGYKEAMDVVRFKVEPVKVKDRLEDLTMQFTGTRPEYCEWKIMWEKTAIVIPVTAHIKERLRKQLNAALLAGEKPYFQAAQFYSEYDKNQAKALEFAGKAVVENPSAFWIWLYKARIEKEMGNNKAALESSKQSLALAKKAKNDDYIKMNEALQKKLQ